MADVLYKSAEASFTIHCPNCEAVLKEYPDRRTFLLKSGEVQYLLAEHKCTTK